MNIFVVTYNSKENCFAGKVAIQAENLVDAQNKFFDWLKKQPVYSHMWGLEFNIELVQST